MVGVYRTLAYPTVGCAGIWLLGRLGRVLSVVTPGGVGSSPHLPCVREEFELFRRHVAGAAEDRGKDLVDSIHAGEFVSALLV